ncbi:uncharacterized protein L203_101791 [Cryptococcus depauperatus CBS 7841]|uniref:Cytochrome c oxidase assembly protein subunit 11 n=1 Tax=Cryptococcus depauperatus CBS 7841 TaxID=1295531 RepID=A0AAJ8M035_9TREE
MATLKNTLHGIRGFRQACPTCRSPLRPTVFQSFRPMGQQRCYTEPPRPLQPDTIPIQKPNRTQLMKALETRQAKIYQERSKKSKSIMLYSAGAIIIALGVTYAAVPLYRAFCSTTGFGGIPMTDTSRFTPDRLYVTPESAARKRITVHFQASSAEALPWKFEPATKSVRVLPGETALAFYKCKNYGAKDLIGIATYNITPDKVAPYFAKVECFCFEEQRIRAGEEVDLPVFFFIDRDIMDDVQLGNFDDVVLNYTFFRAKRNDMGHAVPDASEEAIQKSQGFDKYELAK